MTLSNSESTIYLINILLVDMMSSALHLQGLMTILHFVKMLQGLMLQKCLR